MLGIAGPFDAPRATQVTRPPHTCESLTEVLVRPHRERLGPGGLGTAWDRDYGTRDMGDSYARSVWPGPPYGRGGLVKSRRLIGLRTSADLRRGLIATPSERYLTQNHDGPPMRSSDARSDVTPCTFACIAQRADEGLSPVSSQGMLVMCAFQDTA